MGVYVDKKRGTLFIQFQYRGTRYKERLPVGTSKKDAEKLEVKVKNDLMFQAHGINDPQKNITFETFISEVYGAVADGFKDQAFDRVVLLTKAAMPFLKGKPMRSIKAHDIERFKAARASLLTKHGNLRRPATIEREMSIISGIFAVAVESDIIDYNPCSRVKKLSFDNVQDVILKREDEEKLFANMHSEWARDICRMVLNTGLRQNDLMNLTPFQIDRENQQINLIQGKTKRKVIIPLNSVALEIINRRWTNGLLFASPVSGKSDGSVRHAIQRACIRAKIPILTIRALRRTFGTRLIEDGADAVTAARLLGHSDLRMISRYARSVDLMRNAVNSLNQPTPLRVVKKG